MPEAAAHNLQKTVDEITGYSRRTRKLVWSGVALAVGAAAIGVVVVFLLISVRHQASDVHKAQINACGIGNQLRQEQIQLWNFVIALSAKQPNSNPAAISQFRTYLDRTFAPVNCEQLYKS